MAARDGPWKLPAGECLSPCRPYQVFGGGDLKAILGRAPEEGPAWVPTRLAAPPPPLGRLKKHSLTHGRLLSLPLPAFHLPNPFLWPSPCDFGPWFSFQIGGFQEALQGSDTGYLPCGQLQALCLSSLSGRAPSWAEGPGAGPRVQPSSCSFPSLNSINLSTPLLWG